MCQNGGSTTLMTSLTHDDLPNGLSGAACLESETA